MSQTTPVGTIGWVDLTIADACLVRDFYKAVVGWTSQDVAMGDHADYCMFPPVAGANPVAGVCHARGINADLPPVWLIYLVVADLETSLSECEARGGAVLRPTRACEGQGRMAVIRDPAGAICALFEPAK